MDFYTYLSKYYDVLFPPNPVQIDFLTSYIQANARILDIGAGTGGYAAAMTKLGARVDAAEIGAMYPLLYEKSLSSGFTAMDLGMEALGSLAPSQYDRIVCIGNTLPHLNSEAAVKQFFSEVAGLLVPKGIFIAQVVNFDKVGDSASVDLPLLSSEKDGLRLRRRYARSGEKIQFTTELDTGEGLKTATTELLPLRAETLQSLLLEAGFSAVRVYGDFKGAAWTEESPATVITAEM